MTSPTESHPEEPSRFEIRKMILDKHDVFNTIDRFATEGALDTAELWWFYEEHRIMASGEAWLMAMLFEDRLDDSEESLFLDGEFWKWFDRGRLRY